MATRSTKRLPSTALVLLLACAGCLHRSPGTLHESSTEPLTSHQHELREELQLDVGGLSVDIGPRNAGESLSAVLAAERWVLERLERSGIDARREEIDLGGPKAANVVTTFVGVERPGEILVLGAHYDTAAGSPGANDNASGVALLLATARRLKDQPAGRTVRIVFFVNEENPFTFGLQMGSRIHADRSRARGDDIVAMIAVDSIGYYTSEPRSQERPALLGGLPSTGNFVTFLSNRDNQRLVDRVVAAFQAGSRFPSVGIATDMKAATRSDHAPFWWQGYPALLASDTAEGRDPHYHRPTDTAERLDYDEMARMADGFIRMVQVLAAAEAPLR